MKPGIETPKATFSRVPPALARDGLAMYCPQYLTNKRLCRQIYEGFEYLQIHHDTKGHVARHQETLGNEQSFWEGFGYLHLGDHGHECRSRAKSGCSCRALVSGLVERLWTRPQGVNLQNRLRAATRPATKPGLPTAMTPRSYGPVGGAAAGRSTTVTPTLQVESSCQPPESVWPGGRSTYTTMKTAVNMLAKPIHVNIANFPSVRMLARIPVAMAATSVQTMVQPFPLARILRPWDRPMKPEPVARLYDESVHVFFFRDLCFQNDLHPSEEEKDGSDLAGDWAAHEHRSVDDVVDATVLHSELKHDI